MVVGRCKHCVIAFVFIWAVCGSVIQLLSIVIVLKRIKSLQGAATQEEAQNNGGSTSNEVERRKQRVIFYAPFLHYNPQYILYELFRTLF